MNTDKLWMKFLQEVLNEFQREIRDAEVNSNRTMDVGGTRNIDAVIRIARQRINDKLEEGYWND